MVVGWDLHHAQTLEALWTTQICEKRSKGSAPALAPSCVCSIPGSINVGDMTGSMVYHSIGTFNRRLLILPLSTARSKGVLRRGLHAQTRARIHPA